MLSACPLASILLSAISWIFASESQVLARTSHAHLFWLSSPQFALRRHFLASVRLSWLSDIPVMMVPKAYLFLSHCRSALATSGQAKAAGCQGADARRGAADRGEYRQAAGAVEKATSLKRRPQTCPSFVAAPNPSAAWRNKPAISLSVRPSTRIFRIHSTIGSTHAPAAKRLRTVSLAT